MASPIVIPVAERFAGVREVSEALVKLEYDIGKQLEDCVAASDVAALYVRVEQANRFIDELYSRIAGIANRLKTIRVPEIFDNSKTTTVTSLGYRVTTSQQLRTSIRKEAKEDAFNWLRDNGHGSLIKVEPTVHPETLSAWARTMVQDGEDLPENLFSLFYYQTTSLTKAPARTNDRRDED